MIVYWFFHFEKFESLIGGFWTCTSLTTENFHRKEKYQNIALKLIKYLIGLSESTSLPIFFTSHTTPINVGVCFPLDAKWITIHRNYHFWLCWSTTSLDHDSMSLFIYICCKMKRERNCIHNYTSFILDLRMVYHTNDKNHGLIHAKCLV